MTDSGLRRQIGLRTATALVVGETIAVGIFLTPAGMAKSLGSPALLLAVWVFTGLTALCGALCYGELAARFPEAGGGYVYLREAYGRPVAFLYGWMALLVMDPGLTAALAAGMAGYAAYGLGLSALGAKAVAVFVIVVLAAANVRGVRLGARLVRWLTVLKLGLLALILLWGFGTGAGEWGNFAPFAARREGSPPLFGALAGGLVAAFFSFGGWWDLTKLAGEARDPLFPAAAAALHPRYGTPARAVAVQAALASLLVVLGNFEEIVSYFIFVVVIFLGLTVASLYVLRRRSAAGAGGYRTPGYPFTPAVFLLTVAALLVLLGGGAPGQSLLGAAVVALGLPVYYLVYARAGAGAARTEGEKTHT